MSNNLNTPWARLSQKEKAELIGIYTKHGYNELASIINNYNSYKDGGPLSEEEKIKLINRINSTSKADFVERLKDQNRKTIPYGNGVATHRLAYATDDTGTAIVFPEVQSYEDTLKEFIGRDAIERAIERRDTLNMSIREADWFTKHYKEYYPGFNSYKDGGEKNGVIGRVRKKLYDNVNPYGYERYLQRIFSALRGERDPNKNKHLMIRDDIFATYLQIPEEERHTLDGADDFQKKIGIAKVRDSQYAPTIGGENKQYKAIDLTNKDKFYLVYDALNGNGKPKVSETLTDYFGPHTVNLGFDNNGQYVSYYDKWDLNPSFGRDAIKNKLITLISRKDGEDSTLSVGKPIDFYDRVYLDDYFGVDSTDIPSDSYYGGYIRPAWISEEPGSDYHVTGDDFQGWNPIPIRIYANGGKIHIKESKKGTFTAAAKSRGMGVQEFASKVLANKDEYSPAMVKKANFARNFGGHRHENGGPLDLLKKAFAKNYDADTFSEAFAAARNDDRDYFKWNGNRYNTKLDTESFRESNPSNLKEGYAIQDAIRRIMQVENNKGDKRGGWDEINQRWYPHRSPEGGADTIAYGIKLSNGTQEAELAKKQGYLTDEQALDALDTLVQKYYGNAKSTYDKKFGDGSWDSLSEKSKSILTDYEYNPGLKKFPKLMEGFNEGDLDKIKANYKRYLGRKELGRNRYLSADIDSLATFYPIFK